MNLPNQNPLLKHFRQPAIYINLPSKGNFWSEGSIEIPVNGDLPVYPMTTRDEIAIKTPDALINGAGLVSVIESCCPNIKNAWEMPTVDVDAILISIRIASYGEIMDVESSCPKCNESNAYEINLQQTLSSIVMPDYAAPENVRELSFLLRPLKFQMSNKVNHINFEEQKILRALNDEGISGEEKNVIIANQMDKLIDINLDILTSSTISITTESDTVTDSAFIKEFYQNAETKIIKSVQNRLNRIADDMVIKPYKVQCVSCQHQFEMSVDFNYSSFFAAGF